MNNVQERFWNMHLQEEYDTHDPELNSTPLLPYRSAKKPEISNILVARNIVFALTISGVCVAYNRETNQRLCLLNVDPDEVIWSMFYNKSNDSLITVSVDATDFFGYLTCKTTNIEDIQLGKPDAGYFLFDYEELLWPAFVKFDDVNLKLITYSAKEDIYKVYDMKDYTMLYSISDKNVVKIKVSPGSMLLIHKKSSDHVPLKILSIEDGTVIKSFNHPLHQNKDVEFIKFFNDKLLMKQENENLEILDVNTSELTQVSKTQFMTPSAFIFLHEKKLFLTFRNRTVSVWNSSGELVTSYENHLLCHLYSSKNDICITGDKSLLISYCKSDSGYGSSLNISDVLTGKCLAKIENSTSSPSSPSPFSRIRRSSEAKALEEITAIFYDEDRNEIYTGNTLGLVHVWSKPYKSML